MVTEHEERKLLEKRTYDHLNGRGNRDYFAWDLDLMKELFSNRTFWHLKMHQLYIFNKQVLELGCGRGYAVERLKKFASIVVGIDISRRVLKIARARNSESNVQFVLADAENIPFSDNTFDVVFCNAILHHLDVHKALQEIRRVLIPHGYLYVSAEAGALNPIAWVRRTFFPSHIHTPDEHPFIPSTFRRILYRKGFKEINYYPNFILSPLVPVLGKIFPKIHWKPLLHFFYSLDTLLLKSCLNEFCWIISGIYRASL